MTQSVMVLGAGKIGSLIACLLAESGDYEVHLSDVDPNAAAQVVAQFPALNMHAHVLDTRDHEALTQVVEKHQCKALLSALPYYCNQGVARVARQCSAHYFDLTEDIAVSEQVREISQGAPTAFVPQCGLAPGFISIVANHLMSAFERVESVKMRVGALPLNPNNTLKYSLTWSTDGLINEYGNRCYGIEDGQKTVLLPLEGYETITLDGANYEAFNTSGGLGSLADTYAGKVRSMSYKTVRYPGHCEKIKLLMQELKLNEDRDTLKRILENAVPKTRQDVVLIYVSVTGNIDQQLYEENYAKKIYPQTIAGQCWSAIQITTAAGICSVVDMVITQPARYQGFIAQEQFELTELLENRFGRYYQTASDASYVRAISGCIK